VRLRAPQQAFVHLAHPIRFRQGALGILQVALGALQVEPGSAHGLLDVGESHG
jgi:hypothetical protein